MPMANDHMVGMSTSAVVLGSLSPLRMTTWRIGIYPRPMKACWCHDVMNWTLVSSGRRPCRGRRRRRASRRSAVRGRVAVGLQGSDGDAGAHLGGGVADVDLAAGDVVGAAVERDALGEAGDGVLGGGVGRGVGRGT